MSELFSSRIANWLQIQDEKQGDLYKVVFAEHHLGNIWIRSIHGGVSASSIELCAEIETAKSVNEETEIVISSSTIDYLRITKDADLFARAAIVRQSRRLCVVDVICWQDNEDVPVVRGTVTLKLNQHISPG